MEWAGGERSVTVADTAGNVVIGDNNRIGVPEPAAVRSGYHAQVHRIRPDELVGRERELAELAAFCLADSGPSYIWWRAEAWAGKTALLSWFALNPPPGVRIVPFFVTARLGAQNDVVAYVDVVLEQLAELAGEGLPVLLTAATREAHLLRLYASAAEACAARGERLVLLIDGLDEDRGVTTGPDAHSIASLLPYDLPVIVSGRLNPPLPVDVPEDHPLRDPAAVRILSPSPRARVIRAEAERELKRLLEAEGLPYDLLALLTAAGGGLTADDLAELTGAVPYRVRDLLRTGPGRTFAARGEAYLLAHEELAAGAREMLGERELTRCREVLHGWAGTWRDRGWPATTPAYLLHGYFPVLRAAGDLDRMLACALDEARHDRLLEETGGVGGPLGEVRAAGEAVLERGDGAGLVATMLRLGFRRAELIRRGGRAPVGLAAAWAAAGQVDRALAIVRGEDRLTTVEGLCAVAGRLLAVGERSQAGKLIAEAEELVLTDGDPLEHGPMSEALVPVLFAAGALSRAERIVHSVDDSRFRHGPLLALVDALCAAGHHERALALAHAEEVEGLRVRVVDRVIRALLLTGRADEAERMVRDAAEKGAGLGLAYFLDASRALREAGHEERGAGLRADALRAFDARRWGAGFSETVRALAALGEFDRLDRWASWLFGRPADAAWGFELASAGVGDRARSAAEASPDERDSILRTLADAQLAAGLLDEAEQALDALSRPYSVDLCRRLVSARVRVGHLDRAGKLLSRLEGVQRDKVIGEYARALCGAGLRAEAMTLVTGGRTGALAGIGVADALLDAGDRPAAVALLTSIEPALRAPGPRTVIGTVLSVAKDLTAVDGWGEPVRRLLAEVERHPAAAHGLFPVLALVASGQVDRAEELARGREEWERDRWLRVVLDARLARREHAAVARMAERDRSRGGTFFDQAVRGLVRAGAWEYVEPLVRARPRFEVGRLYAAMAAGLARDGRTDEAGRWLADAQEYRRQGFGLEVVPDLVRALLALDRREEAVQLVARVRTEGSALYRTTQASHVSHALVLLGDHDEATEYARGLPGSTPADLLPVARHFVEAAEFERAASVLAGLHALGLRCADGYAGLALAHPDPATAREFVALALHLGPWDQVLPAVLRSDPGTVPLVLAEAERLCLGLRRALEV
ncbi:hypothetical protein [Streptomyces exfoliatus]|uniref:hypothetical protein n=1 Tax=Streptomyces exfoliatus TaxID=1905 RepID=UPI00068C5886|nr:hypothetical protein [Streptomyces exfoliatus]